MKILVTGGYGQLGRSLFKRRKENKEILWTGKNIPPGGEGVHLDILDKTSLQELINLYSPDI